MVQHYKILLQFKCQYWIVEIVLHYVYLYLMKTGFE